MRKFGWTLLGLALACASPVFGQTSPPRSGPWVFIRMPTVDDMASLYPAAALAQHAGGLAMIRCAVDPPGRLSRCGVVGEDPPGLGFGAATLAVTSEFRVRWAGLEPEQDRDAVVTFTITWLPPAGAGGDAPEPNFMIGQRAGLFTGPDLARDPTPAAAMACLRPQPGHECRFHHLTWAAQPSPDDAAAQMIKYGADHDADMLVCQVDVDHKLTACQATSAQAAAVTQAVLKVFTAPNKTDDGAAIGSGPVAILFDWARLSDTAKAMQALPAAVAK